VSHNDSTQHRASPKAELSHAIALWGLAKHSAYLTGAFLVIFMLAIALDWFVRLVVHFGLMSKDSPIGHTVVAAKFVLLAADLYVFVRLVLKSVVRAVRSM
jgi:hypothetical protein